MAANPQNEKSVPPRAGGTIIPVFRTVDGSVNNIVRVLAGAGAVIFPIIMAGTVWGALARYIFHWSFGWLLEVTAYLMVVSAYLGVAFTLQQGAHVKVDLVLERCSPPVKKALMIVGSLFTLLFGGLLTWASLKQTVYFFKTQLGTESAAVQYWIPETSIVIGFAVFSVLAIILAIRQFSRK